MDHNKLGQSWKTPGRVATLPKFLVKTNMDSCEWRLLRWMDIVLFRNGFMVFSRVLQERSRLITLRKLKLPRALLLTNFFLSVTSGLRSPRSTCCAYHCHHNRLGLVSLYQEHSTTAVEKQQLEVELKFKVTVLQGCSVFFLLFHSVFLVAYQLD